MALKDGFRGSTSPCVGELRGFGRWCSQGTTSLSLGHPAHWRRTQRGWFFFLRGGELSLELSLDV
jgi:hypothetical protein